MSVTKLEIKALIQEDGAASVPGPEGIRRPDRLAKLRARRPDLPPEFYSEMSGMPPGMRDDPANDPVSRDIKRLGSYESTLRSGAHNKNNRDIKLLTDILFAEMAQVIGGKFYDGPISSLMAGQIPDTSYLTHLRDESGRLPERLLTAEHFKFINERLPDLLKQPDKPAT